MLDLDRPWQRPAPTPAQVRHDVLLALGSAAVSVLSVEVFRSANGASLGWQGIEAYLLFALAGLLLAGRRRYPLTVLLAESAVFIVVGERLEELGVVFTIQIILFTALYSAWAWSRHTRRLMLTSALVVAAMFGWLVWEFAIELPGDYPDNPGLFSPAVAIIIYSLVINVIYFFGAMAWGHVAWRSAWQSAEIAKRIQREREAQDRDRDRAVQAERVRIARDLHDVVAHHVSGIGVQAAGAGRVLESRPEDARRALDLIESSSRQAVNQMHQLLGLLRAADDEDGRAPQPGIGDLHTLATSGERPRIAFSQVGDPFDVSATVSASLFRITQEAVANLRRHAHASSGNLVLRYLAESTSDERSVEVEVTDDGRGADDSETSSTGGFGLTGIRERVAMHGGSCEIGPRPGGGFRVRVRIPVVR